jgi:predicted AAA+ superfamily ATPase
MAEEQQPRKEIEPIVLDETSLGEEIERDVTQIDKSEEEEYRTGSEDDEEEGDYSPPEFRKIQTRAALRMTPAKATPKPTPKSISRAPASQGGSSQKKVRKGK